MVSAVCHLMLEFGNLYCTGEIGKGTLSGTQSWVQCWLAISATKDGNGEYSQWDCTLHNSRVNRIAHCIIPECPTHRQPLETESLEGRGERFIE